MISLDCSFASKRLLIETYLEELNSELLEKNELQLQGKSILTAVFGISSFSGSQNEMFQQEIFWSILVYFEPIGTTRAKNAAPKKIKEKSVFHIQC